MLSKLLTCDIHLCRIAILNVLLLGSTPANAGQEWTCKKKGLVRTIAVKADAYGKPPCTTIYGKPTEKKPDRTIAKAERDFPLCEAKAEELALKLQNLDWECAREDS